MLGSSTSLALGAPMALAVLDMRRLFRLRVRRPGGPIEVRALTRPQLAAYLELLEEHGVDRDLRVAAYLALARLDGTVDVGQTKLSIEEDLLDDNGNGRGTP